MPKVSYAQRPYSCTTLRVACLDIAITILSIGIDIIGNISPKSSNGHEFISLAIDYFTKWVEVASYAKLTFAKVVNFIKSYIIYHSRVPHELISDKGAHFRVEVETLLQKYDIQHHKSSTYRL